MGHAKTVVEGLNDDEATEFIDSRVRLMELPLGAVPDERRAEVASLCEGSPLYIEDFLRLLRFLPFDQAVTSWRSESGDDVRQYALQREMEMLTPLARSVLEVCSYAEGPISIVELERITDRKEAAVFQALDELRQLYLVPVPKLIETVPRFLVNENVALLVRAATDGSGRELGIRNAIGAILGDGLAHLDSVVRDHVRQAMVLGQSGRFEDAEATIQSGLDVCPNHPHLLSILGWVYSKWTPHKRLADARSAWNRSYQLGSSERAMFMSWFFLEMGEKEYGASALVAEHALERVSSGDAELLRLAGWARHRLGETLAASLLADRAKVEFQLADVFLRKAIDIATSDVSWHSEGSRAFQVWVRNARSMNNDRQVCDRLKRWIRWNPEDRSASREAERERHKCPQAIALLSSLGAERSLEAPALNSPADPDLTEARSSRLRP